MVNLSFVFWNNLNKVAGRRVVGVCGRGWVEVHGLFAEGAQWRQMLLIDHFWNFWILYSLIWMSPGRDHLMKLPAVCWDSGGCVQDLEPHEAQLELTLTSECCPS